MHKHRKELRERAFDDKGLIKGTEVPLGAMESLWEPGADSQADFLEAHPQADEDAVEAAATLALLRADTDMSQEKVEDIIEEMFDPVMSYYPYVEGVEDRLEKEGYELTKAGEHQLRSALADIAEDMLCGHASVAESVGRTMEVAGGRTVGGPSSDEEGERILQFLRSDAGETFMAYFLDDVTAAAQRMMANRLTSEDDFYDPLSVEEIVEAMKAADPHPIFESETPPDRDSPSPEDPLFKSEE